MKTQTDRKIAEELQRTYEVQREAQLRRQLLERETSVANMQAEVVRSEQMVAISQKNAMAMEETARGDAARVKLAAEAEAQSMRFKAIAQAEGTKLAGDAEAHATRATGVARAEAYREGVAAMGSEAYVAVQLASVLGEHHVKLVPDIAVGGEGGLGAGAGVDDAEAERGVEEWRARHREAERDVNVTCRRPASSRRRSGAVHGTFQA